MSSIPLPAPRHARPGARIALVAARFNQQHVDALIERCIDELERLDPDVVVDIHRVPGSFEIPLAAKLALQSEHAPDAVIAFGVLLEGETAHALLVAQSVTHSLQELALESLAPVIHQVLLVADEEQARQRTQGETINRGTEAARAALGAIEDLRRIGRRPETATRSSLPTGTRRHG